MRASLILVATLGAGPALACGEAPVTMTGTLHYVISQHPNGTEIAAVQIHLDRPIEAVGTTAGVCDPVTIIDLVGADPSVSDELAQRVGERVSVTSPDIFTAHTAWHIGEAVAMSVTFVE